MGIRQNGDVLRQVHLLFGAGTAGDLTDRELLERYTNAERAAAELAFATLVERHGPMVLRVCRRVLLDPHEAEDAFQATFLVLARRAGSVRRRDSLGSWLHGVALRVAGCARKSNDRRRWYERRSAERAAGDGVDVGPEELRDDDLAPLLHEELGGLPERFRAPIVLCYLEGHTCEQAARRLNWPVGTVKSRLSRGRDALRVRLARRGLAPSAGAIAGLLAAEGVAGTVPAALGDATARAASTIAAGQAAMAGVVPAAAAELLEGVLKTMTIIHRRRIAAGVLAIGLAASGTAVSLRRAVGDDPAPPPRELARVSLPEYVVEPPDMIRVEVSGTPPGRPVSGERLVRPDGRINLGDYGELYVAGLTPMEIRQKLAAYLERHLRSDEAERSGDGPGARPPAPRGPLRVDVDVVAYNSKVYYVQGNVASPGRIPVTGSETVLDAINYAGGVTGQSTTAKVRLIRPAPPGAAGGQVLNVDLDAIISRGDPTTNYQILPGDRILVVADARPAPGPDRDGPRPAVEVGDLRRLEDRLTEVERRLDRVIELLGGLPQPARPARPAPRPR